uniref:VWFC domain-containing protein n=1 Tax=Meloidogyne floridensis TaxID=298350 RepID=A0A915NLR5_9BILA
MFLVFFLILILFAKQEATKLDNNTETIREEGGEKEEATETTITMKNEEATKTEANRIIEANKNKNEAKKENETKDEIEASNKTEAKNKTKDEAETKNEAEAKVEAETKNEAETKVTKSVRQEESTTTLDDVNEEEYISASTIATSSSSNTSTDRCLHVDCPILFPDCPSDSVPILSFTPTTDNSSLAEDNCCSLTRVECKCDSQKCLVPICPEGTELTFTHNGSDKPGQCCDQFECRLNEPSCQNVHCPDTSSIILDLYSPDGHTCPDDSYRPKPYIPTGGCCSIVSQCQCKLSICEPQLLILERGRGEPGQCCDKFKCVNEGDEIEGLFLESSSNSGCRYGGHIYAKGEHWHAAPCQECECSSAGVALCKRMECPALSQSSFSSSSSCPSLSNCDLLCQYGLNQNNFTGCFECKCAGDGGENNNVVEIEEEEKQQQQQEDPINITTNCETVAKENCLYNDHAYSVGENFQDGPFRNCSCLLGGMLKCVEIHCPPCSSLSLPVISTTAKFENNQQIETTTGMNWCLQLCLQQQRLTENNKEQQQQQQQQLVAFERGSEETLLFENLQQQNNSTTIKGINNNNNKHLPHHHQQQQQQTWPQPHWLFIVAALIVGIPAFALLLLFAIYLLLAVLFNSKYRKCGKQRNIEQSMLPITNNNNQNNNNKWHIFQLIPKHFTK